MKNSFRFAFTPLVWILLIAVLIISIGGVAINVYNAIIISPLDSAFGYISFSVLCLILSAFTLSVILHSKYKIKEGKLHLYFGFVRTSYQLNKAINLTHFTDKNMLVLFFSGEEYTRIVINKSKFPSFAERIKEENINILYSQTKEEKE